MSEGRICEYEKFELERVKSHLKCSLLDCWDSDLFALTIVLKLF